MTVSGGIKFFYENFGDINNDSAYAVVDTGSDTRNNARSRKRYLKWSSVGSDDLTTETYTLHFGETKTIDRILLVRNNFKAFTVKYDNAGWTHFASVVTKEGSQANITEAANTKTTNYYEFTPVSTTKIQVSVDTTQVVDAEKEMHQLIATAELGTFTGYPQYSHTFVQNAARKKTFEGNINKSILGESYQCSLGFQRYGLAADHTIVQALWDLEASFLIYPCGANEDQFRYTTKQGNRLRDIYLVSFAGNFSPDYDSNVYDNGLNYTLNLVESA